MSRILNPSDDWITQKELAALLGISERTASVLASTGELKLYEHRMPGCGRKKYSRTRVRLQMEKLVLATEN